ncbi:MAG: glycosyltransferase [Lachnospiraceae bacterium]|nr:glycosyltransferase [Lachnospiraceae bacterium]
MRIVVLDIAASKTGALSVLQDFASYVQNNEKKHDWIFVTGAEGLVNPLPDSPNVRILVRSDVKKSKFARLYFEHVTGRDFLSDLKPDVIFSLQNTIPRGAESVRNAAGGLARKVLYIHQPLGFQKWKRFSFLNKWERECALYQYLISGEIDSSAKKADQIIVQTEWMKEAVGEKCGIPEGRIKRIMPDIPDLSDFRDPALSWSPKKFLFPSGPIFYKNHTCIVDAVKLLQKRGIEDFQVFFTLRKRDLPWVDNCRGLVWLGSLSREMLLRFYQVSTLIFPSYIETFGYPPAEARQFGVPILASDMPFCREVLGDYKNVRYFHPFRPEELADQMQDIILSRDLLKEKNRGREKSQSLSEGVLAGKCFNQEMDDKGGDGIERQVISVENRGNKGLFHALPIKTKRDTEALHMLSDTENPTNSSFQKIIDVLTND